MGDDVDSNRRSFFGLMAGVVATAPSMGLGGLSGWRSPGKATSVLSLELEKPEWLEGIEYIPGHVERMACSTLSSHPGFSNWGRLGVQRPLIDPRLDPDIDCLRSVSLVVKHRMQRERDRQ